MKIARYALLTTLIGIIALLLLSNYLEPKLKNISEITNLKIGETVKIQGDVTKMKIGEYSLFNLKDKTGTIRVFAFEKLNLTNKEFISVIGKIQNYHSHLEINAIKIKKLSN